ncbi:MAG: hypothetical protein LLG04_10775 [Parachlamydia sp.]|nr:hypothetical protein [Parachlamydia sp.]
MVTVYLPHPFLSERDVQNGQTPKEEIAEALLPTKEAGQIARRSLSGKGRGGEHLRFMELHYQAAQQAGNEKEDQRR